MRVPVCYWTFTGHDEGFCHDRAIAASRSYGSFVGHDELSWVFRAVVSGKLRWHVAQWPWSMLQGCTEWRVGVICASRRWDVMVLEGIVGSDGGPQRRLMFMIGMSTRAFLLHSVNFCLHGCYFALGFGQLVCSVQSILLDS